MLIDWFTVGAQALNFLILVWLMKHFLYRPILTAIDTREKKIAAELADAAAKKAEAARDRDDFQKKNAAFEQQRTALLAKAIDEAKAEGQRLLDEAKKTADALSAKRQETLRNDAHSLNQAIARRAQQEVFSIARKALGDLATASLEERLAAVFIRQLGRMNGNAKETLGAALKSAGQEPVVVRSAFELPTEERAKIRNAINETFSIDAPLRFETSPDLVGGIELTANGQKVAWSIEDYLKSLEKGVGEILKQQDKPDAKPIAKTEPKPESKPEVKVAPETGTKPTPEKAPKAKATGDTESKVADKAPATPQKETEPEPKVESPPDTKAAGESKAAKLATVPASS